jgi:hypothetical protein
MTLDIVDEIEVGGSTSRSTTPARIPHPSRRVTGGMA